MNKEIIGNIIREGQDFIPEIQLYHRQAEYEIQGNYVFVGVRQCGKSYMLYQRIQQLLEEGHDILFSLKNYASKFSERETIKKHYFVDNGLLNIFLNNDQASLLENLCAIHLYQRYSMGDVNTSEREINALLKLHSFEPLERAIIITRDEESIVKKDNLTIEVKSIWKWLLE